jgi:hypothetical protein
MQFSTAIQNGSGAEVRARINNAFQTVSTDFAGATDPSAMTPSCAYPYCTWIDTSNGLVKKRNAANTAWIDIGTVDITTGEIFLFDVYGQRGAIAISTNFTLTLLDANKLVVANSANNLTITLPNEPTQYTSYKIFNKGTGTVEINGGMFYSITGSASNIVLAQYQSVVLASDGLAYYSV